MGIVPKESSDVVSEAVPLACKEDLSLRLNEAVLDDDDDDDDERSPRPPPLMILKMQTWATSTT